ncbi:Tn3 family transposase [Acetivibrio saccincola]|uniref:Tn3 transposase DDE domain protein n=1 Tax=Acetivibrio saccincola TaxID=1677857 RepID=A0A2K9E9X6_9FIRM|nr:Tn3 family transposase [Acetivibrio saccincola]AUG56864.1 Tn3 transposase DDE domain protein [Acetivibrio saccincola]
MFYICFNINIVLCKSFYHKVVIKKIVELGKLIKPVQANQTLGSSLSHKNVQVEPSILSKDTQITGINKMSSTEKKASVFSNIPAEEDLKETSEAQFTEEIKELAESLNSVIEIYEYVWNNINFEAYYGSRKGAVGTLDQMAGNDIDQASLLISLLRYKGIPARYVRGTIEIPVEKVMGWTGGETPQDAVRILASLGIPTVSVVSGGKISHVRTEHVWVEAYVPYQYYRGAGPMKGQKIWVPLDPSFKQHEKIEGLDLSSIIDIDTEASIEGFKDGIIVSDKLLSVSRVNVQSVSEKIENVDAKIEEFINQKGLEKIKSEELIGGKRIIPQDLDMLPLSLPYKVDAVYEKTSVVPKELRENRNLKLGKISDIPYQQLLDVYYKYFRKATLQEANKIISNEMRELSIFPYYSFDLTTLYGSVDGQKLGVKHPTIKARHSKKYFGKGRGMVSYGMLVNHNYVIGDTIGANEHESYFVFDIHYNNITDIVPDAITGDMHSINKANFAILHWFKVYFRPRFTNLETQLKHLYCGDEPENYHDYYIKPVGQTQIDKKLIVEEWPKIKQIILTLANKEITQNKIIKKLCTYKQTRTLKAIFEFDKLIRSIYTLKYLMDPKLQQDVHRSQNRIESFHQLRAAIASVNGKKQLSGKTDIEIDISNQCGRLIANIIVYYNSALLSLILEKYKSCNNTKAIEKLKRVSPVAWQHIHLLGHYAFCSNKCPIDLEEIISVLQIK